MSRSLSAFKTFHSLMMFSWLLSSCQHPAHTSTHAHSKTTPGRRPLPSPASPRALERGRRHRKPSPLFSARLHSYFRAPKQAIQACETRTARCGRGTAKEQETRTNSTTQRAMCKKHADASAPAPPSSPNTCHCHPLTTCSCQPSAAPATRAIAPLSRYLLHRQKHRGA